MEKSLQGSIKLFKLPEIFQLLATGRSAGTLGLQRDDNIVMIYFKQGRIIYAYGPRQNRHLGQILKEKGRLTDTQLQDAVNTQSSVSLSKRLGEILLEKEYIKSSDLTEVVSEQIRDLIYSLLSWDDGSFKFYENQYPTKEEITVDLSVENVIMEGARRIDEVNRLRNVLPDYETRFRISSVDPGRRRDISLETEEWNLLARIDGRKTIKEIVDESALNEASTLQKLAALQLAGLIEEDKDPQLETGHLEMAVNRVAGLLDEYIQSRTETNITIEEPNEPAWDRE